MTIHTRDSRLAGARATLATWAALLLTTLSVLAGLATPAAAQPRTRGRVSIEVHHTDLAGNIRLSTDEAGAVTQAVVDYTPFGEIIGQSCNGGGDAPPSPKFQGKLRDPKTCLDDFGVRDYYMVTGRFQSVDPVLPVETALRDPQQWNRYAYARNNPLIYTDPDGRILRTNAPETILAIAGDAASRITIENGVVDTSALTDADLDGNQGALLLSQLARSTNTYTYEEKVMDRGLTNFNNRYDERYHLSKDSKGKSSDVLPPAGVDGQ